MVSGQRLWGFIGFRRPYTPSRRELTSWAARCKPCSRIRGGGYYCCHWASHSPRQPFSTLSRRSTIVLKQASIPARFRDVSVDRRRWPGQTCGTFLLVPCCSREGSHRRPRLGEIPHRRSPNLRALPAAHRDCQVWVWRLRRRPATVQLGFGSAIATSSSFAIVRTDLSRGPWR